jgi:hypothetical protein
MGSFTSFGVQGNNQNVMEKQHASQNQEIDALSLSQLGFIFKQT